LFDDLLSGSSVQRLEGRVIVLDEDGITPVAICELRKCILKKFASESHNAAGTNAAMFTFVFQPEDLQWV
jgi:hypothetical protein